MYPRFDYILNCCDHTCSSNLKWSSGSTVRSALGEAEKQLEIMPKGSMRAYAVYAVSSVAVAEAGVAFKRVSSSSQA